MNFLHQMDEMMREEKLCLPGSVLLGTAFCSYCGFMNTEDRQELVKHWEEILDKLGIRYKHNFLPHMMTSSLRMNVSQKEARIIKENLAILSTTKPPILVIDPIQVALEYLELFHADEKMKLLHIGDPELRDQFNMEAANSNVAIVVHSTLDLDKFYSLIDLSKVRPKDPQPTGKEILDSGGSSSRDMGRNRGKLYHVSPNFNMGKLRHIRPYQVISFGMDKSDVNRYVGSRLAMLMPDKAGGRSHESSGESGEAGQCIATDKDKFETELAPYINNPDLIIDFNHLTQSVERIRRIFEGFASEYEDRSTKKDLIHDMLEVYSEMLTNVYKAVSLCPFLEAIPISLQLCLTMSKKNLEAIDEIEKKDLTEDKVATIIIENIMKHYDTNLQSFDVIAIKTCLVTYLASLSVDDVKDLILVTRQLSEGLSDVNLFVRTLQNLEGSMSKTTKTMVSMIKSISRSFNIFEKAGEQIMHSVISQRINCDRDLYRVYAKSNKETPTILNVEADIAFLESMARFSLNFTLDDFIMVDLTYKMTQPVRLLEDSMEKPIWILCVGIAGTSDCANLLDFLIRRLKTSKTIHDNFRLWIICQDIKAINLATAQKSTTHYLGVEFSDQEVGTLEREYHYRYVAVVIFTSSSQ